MNTKQFHRVCKGCIGALRGVDVAPTVKTCFRGSFVLNSTIKARHPCTHLAPGDEARIPEQVPKTVQSIVRKFERGTDMERLRIVCGDETLFFVKNVPGHCCGVATGERQCWADRWNWLSLDQTK
jgi:hypothetical protein